MEEFDIIDKAVKRLQELSGIEVHLNLEGNNKNMADGVINIGKKPGMELTAEVKSEIREPQIPGLLNKMKKYNGKSLLVSRYFPDPIKDHLKDKGVNYLETAGNCFISSNNLFISMIKKLPRTEKPVKVYFGMRLD